MSILKVARRYYELGLTPIPCEPRSKKPACAWAQWEYCRPSWEELEVVWRDAVERFGEDLNIATILGKVHGLCAIDIDSPETFKQARHAIGLTERDLRTWITLSHRGGALIFRYPNGYNLPSKTPNELWGAELLGNERILVLPPSVHPEGTPYRWLKGHEPDQIPLADIPEPLLFAFIGERPKRTLRSVTLPQNDHGDGNELPAWARSVVALLQPHWQEGWRHDTALALAGVFAKRGVPKEIAKNILRKLTREVGDNEVKDRLRALMDTYERLAEGESVLAWQGLERVLDEEILQALDRLLPDPPRKSDGDKRVIRLLTLSEWDERLAHISQGQWLVEELLQTGWLLVINARPKVGKSIVSVNLATALAEGTPFLNLPTSPCAVVYVDLERPIETLTRFKALNAVSNLNIFVPAERIGADMLDALRELVKQAHDLTNRPVVVFVDTLGDFLKPALRQRKASINDYDAIAEILQALRDLALELGCAFVFVHHTRKAQSEEPTEVDVLGSTAIAGKFDVIAHLQPDRTDTSILALTVEGNAIAKTTLHFAIGDGFRVTPCEPPAKTKEEQAAREIRRLLERHPEGLQRGELLRYLLDIGLAETEDGTMRLFHRAIKLLPIEAKRSGQRTVYVLTGERLIPTEPTEGKSDKRDTYREFVTLVTHPEKLQQNKAEKEVTSDCLSCHSSPENSDNSDNIGLSLLSRLSHIASENSDKPLPRCHTSCHSQNASKIRASAECVTTVTNPIPMSHLSHIQTPEPPSPEPPEPYATLRDDELVDAEPLIAELDATELPPQSENSGNDLSQAVKFVDTEKWLDELCAELTANPPEPTEPEPTNIEVLVWQCERCGRVFERLVEADLFGSPKCRYCGGTLKIRWQRSDKP
jgi:hypothetical protein